MNKISRKIIEKTANKRFVRFLIIFALIGILAYVWQQYSQSPSIGVVSDATVMNQKNVQTTAASVDKVHYDGKTIGYDYPSYYSAPSVGNATAQAVEQLSQVASFGPTESRRISITVMKNTNPIEEDSGYKFRKLASSKYLSEFVTINGKKIEKLTKSGGGEVDYYIPGKNYYAVIAVSTSRVGGDYLADGLQIANSIAWIN